MKSVIVLLLVVLSTSLISGLTIDDYAENSGTASTNAFCACLNTNTTCVITPGQNVSIGNHRGEILIPLPNLQGIPWQIGCSGDTDYTSYCNDGLAALTGCPTTGCVGNYGTGGQLAFATPPASRAILYQIWDGGCATSFNNINYVGLGGADLTDGGIADSFDINIGKVDLAASLTIYIWTDATHGSTASFDPASLSRSANLDGAYTRSTSTFANDFTQINGTQGPASFNNVGAIAIQILGTDALDLIIALIETAGVLNLQKSSNLTTDLGVLGVANPGDVVTYNLTLQYNSFGSPVANVYLWDDPSRDFKLNPANYFPYYSLVPGSLIVTTYNINPVNGQLTPANYSYTEINGPNVAANNTRVVLYLGSVTEYTYYSVFFAIRIPPTLPCCLPTCRSNCNITSGNEPCYCIANTAYYCENSDGTNLNFTNANGQQPNFNTAFVDANCGYSTVPQQGTRAGSASSTVPRITITPVYAPSSPYVAFTTPAPPTSVAPGAQVCATFIVGNNGTRDTSASVALSYNTAYLTPSSSGSSPGFTCSGSSCVSGVNSYLALQSATYTLCFTANSLTTCTPVQTQFSVAITPGNCANSSLTGPINNGGNGTEQDGSIPLGTCVDVSSADNSAVSSSTTISGSAVLSVASNFTNTAIAPSGTSVLTICYSNTGNTPSPSSVITVSLPSGVSASGSGWTVSGTSASYNVGTINQGTTCAPLPALTITYTATTLTCQNANLNFNVLLSSFCGNATSSSTLQPTGNTAISLTKTASVSSVNPGATVTYSLSYTNNGSRTFDTVTLNDTVPANTVYSGNNGWVCSPNNNAGSVCTATVAANGAAVPFQVTVNANTTCDVTSITNTATAQGYCAGPPVSFATNVVTAVAPVTVTGNPDFYVTKVATDGNGNALNTVQAGAQVTYVISYGNRGQRISSATITEGAVQSPFSFVGPSTWSGPDANGQRTVTVSNVAPGQTGNVTFVVSAATTLSTCLGQAVPNTVNIAPNSPCVDANTADNNATATVTVTGNVDLYIYFTNVSTYVIPTSTTASLQFCYGNQGNSVANNASMTVNLPSGITAATANNNGFTVNGQTVTYFIGNVAANQAATCRTLFVNLPTTLNCTDSSYASTASITSSCTETNTTNNVTPYSFAVTATFDLYIGLTQPANASVSQVSPQITYCLTYGNNGAKSVTPVILYENLPVNTTFIASASDSRWVAAGNGVYTLNLGSVASNSYYNTCIAFTVSANLPISASQTQITNSAYISNNGVCGAEVTLANNNASVTTQITGNPDLFVLKTNNGASFLGAGSTTTPVGNAYYFTGNVVVYNISYGNNGQADAYNATLTETVPQYTVFDSLHSNLGWSCADGAVAGSTCSINIGRVPVAAGNAQNVIYASVSFAARATVYSGAVYGYTPAIQCPQPPTLNLVTISVASPQVDLNQGNNQANATTPFLGLPNLFVTKVVNNPQAVYTAGQVITYNVTYGNNGVRQAINAILTDTIPEYTIFNAAASAPGFVVTGGGVGGSNVSFSLGNLAPGQSGVLQIAVTLQSGFSANAVSTQNCAEISNSCFGGNETTLVDNIACATVNITGYFDLVLQKHGYCESILFTMNYENIGNIGAAEVYLKAYVPQDTTFDANNSAAGWICTADTPGSTCRYPVTSGDLLSSGTLDYLAPGASGSVNFAVTPYSSSMSTTYTLEASIDDNLTGEDLDPTPDNNYSSVTVGFSGCAACDSCCPEVDQCCPDYTDIQFQFGGVLDGLNTCS